MLLGMLGGGCVYGGVFGCVECMCSCEHVSVFVGWVGVVCVF